MRADQISPQEFRLYQTLCQNPRHWFTNVELAAEAKVAPRTARAYTRHWLKLGIVQVAHVFPAYKFKWATPAGKRSNAYVNRLKSAEEIICA